MLEPRTPHRPSPPFRARWSDLAQASAWTRLALIAPVLVLIWVLLALLVQA